MDDVHGESDDGGRKSSYDEEEDLEEKKQKRGHAVCLPCPAPSHISVMLKLAKLLHQRAGFRITFVNTEFNHARFLSSHPSFFSTGLDDFQFVTIPVGLPPPSDPDEAQDVPELCEATRIFMPLPFSRLIAALLETSSDEPPEAFLASSAMVSCRSPPLLRLGSLTSLSSSSDPSLLLHSWPPDITEPSKDKLRPLAPRKGE